MFRYDEMHMLPHYLNSGGKTSMSRYCRSSFVVLGERKPEDGPRRAIRRPGTRIQWAQWTAQYSHQDRRGEPIDQYRMEKKMLNCAIYRRGRRLCGQTGAWVKTLVHATPHRLKIKGQSRGGDLLGVLTHV